jgi:hypothetical protein
VSAIGPGDWVECVNPEVGDGSDFVRLGAIYCVEELVGVDWPTPCCGGVVGMELVGVPRSEDEAWCPCAFRPIYRPNADFIEHLKQPAPEIVREFIDA